MSSTDTVEKWEPNDLFVPKDLAEDDFLKEESLDDEDDFVPRSLVQLSVDAQLEIRAPGEELTEIEPLQPLEPNQDNEIDQSNIVIKGAAEFISGRRAELESTDLAFLEQIKEAQGVADASLFDDDEDELFTVGEAVEEVVDVVEVPSEPQPEPLDLNSFDAKDWGNFFATDGAMVPQEKKYDIVNNDLTAALDAQHNAVEAWAKQEGVVVREHHGKSRFPCHRQPC